VVCRDKNRLFTSVAHRAARRRDAVLHHPAHRGAHALGAEQDLKGAWPTLLEGVCRRPSLDGCHHTDTDVSDVEDRHVGLDHHAALDWRDRDAEYRGVGIYTGHQVAGNDVYAVEANDAIGMLSRPRMFWRLRFEVLDKPQWERIARAECGVQRTLIQPQWVGNIDSPAAHHRHI
jgi:hypothetical protein